MRLAIANIAVRQDKDGRYSLNDLHKAAGGEDRHKPANFLRLESTLELVAEIEHQIAQIRAIESRQRAGTYVVKELVYAYAMWISPRFNLQVIRAYDALVNGDLRAQDWKRLRHEAMSSFKVMAEVLKVSRETAGKSVAPHHYVNEARLVNWALTGEFRSVDRNSLSASELDVLAKLEALNSVLLATGVDYATRKLALESNAAQFRRAVMPAASVLMPPAGLETEGSTP